MHFLHRQVNPHELFFPRQEFVLFLALFVFKSMFEQCRYGQFAL